MIRRSVLLLLAAALISLHIIALQAATHAWNDLSKTDSLGVTLPPSVLKIVSLEFDNVVADYLFLRTTVFIGGKFQKGSGFVLDQEEWAGVNTALSVTSDLDPYFKDPYYLANAYLIWDAGMVTEANVLLEKGTNYRTWDWTLPFFAGFNHFYFLEDHEKASEYLYVAAKRPGASLVLASLASKLALKANRLENSIAFLEQILDRTEDEDQRKEFQMRIDALRTRSFLGTTVARYRTRYGRSPRSIDELVSGGLLRQIPPDPAGGVFSLGKDGTVISTADDRLVPKRHAPKTNRPAPAEPHS